MKVSIVACCEFSAHSFFCAAVCGSDDIGLLFTVLRLLGALALLFSDPPSLAGRDPMLKALSATAKQFNGGELLLRCSNEGTILGRAANGRHNYRMPAGWLQISGKHACLRPTQVGCLTCCSHHAHIALPLCSAVFPVSMVLHQGPDAVKLSMPAGPKTQHARHALPAMPPRHAAQWLSPPLLHLLDPWLR